jgi:hypothetical protein
MHCCCTLVRQRVAQQQVRRAPPFLSSRICCRRRPPRDSFGPALAAAASSAQETGRNCQVSRAHEGGACWAKVGQQTCRTAAHHANWRLTGDAEDDAERQADCCCAGHFASWQQEIGSGDSRERARLRSSMFGADVLRHFIDSTVLDRARVCLAV